MYSFKDRLNNSFLKIQSITVVPDRLSYLILFLILLSILAIRLTTINSPSLKWTQWKEIDYLTISKNYWQHGYRFLQPEVTWPAEPPRVTEMELPLVPFVAAVLYQLFGFNASAARIVPLIAYLVMIIYVYKLTKRELDAYTGLVAGMAAGLMPLYHPFSNMLFTEPAMIAMSVVSLYYTAEWIEYQRRREQILALLAITLTFSLKLESLYLLFPLSWIAFRKYRLQFKQYFGFILLIALSFILPIIWYSYAYYLENTCAHLFGIFKGHDKSQTLTMLTDYHWYRTMAGRVLNGIFGGLYGSALFLLGLGIIVVNRKGGLFLAYLASICIYFALIAEGQIDAPYRQLSIVPPSSIFMAVGAYTFLTTLSVLSGMSLKSDPVRKPWLLVIPFVFVLLIPFGRLSEVFREDVPVYWDRWALSQEIVKYTDANSRLVVVGEYTSHVGGFDLSPVIFYYSNLQGWILTPEHWTVGDVEALRERGATHFVVAPLYGSGFNNVPIPSYELFVNEMKSLYPIIYENQVQLILDLRMY